MKISKFWMFTLIAVLVSSILSSCERDEAEEFNPPVWIMGNWINQKTGETYTFRKGEFSITKNGQTWNLLKDKSYRSISNSNSTFYFTLKKYNPYYSSVNNDQTTFPTKFTYSFMQTNISTMTINGEIYSR